MIGWVWKQFCQTRWKLYIGSIQILFLGRKVLVLVPLYREHTFGLYGISKMKLSSRGGESVFVELLDLITFKSWT